MRRGSTTTSTGQTEEPCSSCGATIVRSSDWAPGSSPCWPCSWRSARSASPPARTARATTPRRSPPSAAPARRRSRCSEFKLDPSMISAPVDGTITVTNGGTVDHNFAVKDTDVRTKTLHPGESATVSLKGLKEGDYTAICEIPGHADSGMKAMLMVGGSSGSGAATDHDRRAHRSRHDEQHGDGQADHRLHRAAQERHEHQGRRQPAARADGAPRRHEAVRPDHQDRRLGGRAGQDREGLDVQRHGARTDDQGRRRRQGQRSS